MNWLYFTGVDPSLPAPYSRYLPGWVSQEGSRDEAVAAFTEQILAQVIDSSSARDDLWRPSRPGNYLILVIYLILSCILIVRVCVF